MNPLEEKVDFMLGLDHKKEIFDLWYEITYLRHIINIMLSLSPEICDKITPTNLKEARNLSKIEVMTKFNKFNITFGEEDKCNSQE